MGVGVEACVLAARELPSRGAGLNDVADVFFEVRLAGRASHRTCRTEVVANSVAPQYAHGCCAFEDVPPGAQLELRAMESDVFRSMAIGSARTHVLDSGERWVPLEPGPGAVRVRVSVSARSPAPPPLPPAAPPPPPPPPAGTGVGLAALQILPASGASAVAALAPPFQRGRMQYGAAVRAEQPSVRVAVLLAASGHVRRGSAQEAWSVRFFRTLPCPGERARGRHASARARSSAARGHASGAAAPDDAWRRGGGGGGGSVGGSGAEPADDGVLEGGRPWQSVGWRSATSAPLALCPAGTRTHLGVLVRAADGLSERLYTVAVRRARAGASTDARLRSLQLRLLAPTSAGEGGGGSAAAGSSAGAHAHAWRWSSSQLHLRPPFRAAAAAAGAEPTAAARRDAGRHDGASAGEAADCGLLVCGPPTVQWASVSASAWPFSPRLATAGSDGGRAGPARPSAGADGGVTFLASHSLYEVGIPDAVLRPPEGSPSAAWPAPRLVACAAPSSARASLCALRGVHSTAGSGVHLAARRAGGGRRGSRRQADAGAGSSTAGAGGEVGQWLWAPSAEAPCTADLLGAGNGSAGAVDDDLLRAAAGGFGSGGVAGGAELAASWGSASAARAFGRAPLAAGYGDEVCVSTPLALDFAAAGARANGTRAATAVRLVVRAEDGVSRHAFTVLPVAQSALPSGGGSLGGLGTGLGTAGGLAVVLAASMLSVVTHLGRG